MSSTTSSESDMGANKARSIRHASQRKAYHLTEQDDDKYVITETRLAYGKQRTFPNKWQVQVSNRQPLHTSQRPSKSILRRRQATGDAAGGIDQIQARLATMSLHNRNKVRFTNRNDQRFYIKMSKSVQQLIKMTNNNHKKNNKQDATTASGDPVLVEIPSSEEEEDCNTTTTIQEITEAVQTGQHVKEILHLLQDHQELAALHHHQDGKTTDNDDWLATLYRQVKAKLQHDGDDKCNNRHNLEQIKKLLNIYKTAESVIASSRALKQWSRFQVTVESISNLKTIDATPLVADMVYRSSSSSNKQPKQQSSQPLGPTTALADFINATTGRQIQGSPAPKYCINHNFGLIEERPELTFTVSSQGEEGDATTQPVGHVRIPCALFRFFSTQPKETYSLDQRLVVPVQQSSSNQCSSSNSNNNTVRVKFAIQKVPLKKDFLNKKRTEVAVKLQMIVDWIHRFNRENKDSAVLSSHILCSKSGLSLLHAAILVQDRSCVQQILALGANPFHNNSAAGSAMNLALNMMDRYDHRPDSSASSSNHQKLFWDMIQDLQQSSISRSSSHHASTASAKLATQQHPKGEDAGTEKENHRGRRKLKLGHHRGPYHRSKSSSKSRSKSRTDGGTEKENRRGRKLKQGQQHAPQHRSKSSSKVRSKSRTGSRPLTDRRSKAGQ